MASKEVKEAPLTPVEEPPSACSVSSSSCLLCWGDGALTDEWPGSRGKDQSTPNPLAIVSTAPTLLFSFSLSPIPVSQTALHSRQLVSFLLLLGFAILGESCWWMVIILWSQAQVLTLGGRVQTIFLNLTLYPTCLNCDCAGCKLKHNKHLKCLTEFRKKW